LINSNQFKQPWPVLPFGLCCIASTLNKDGYNVRVLDLNFVKNIEEKIAKTIQDFCPELIGVSVRNIDNSVGFNPLFLLDDIKNNIITPLKKYNIPIILGGVL
jgi:deoxyxylulose-5-phosphate synthase